MLRKGFVEEADTMAEHVKNYYCRNFGRGSSSVVVQNPKREKAEPKLSYFPNQDEAEI